MKTFGTVLAVAAAAVMACQERTAPETSPSLRLVHPNGLELSQPPGFGASQTAAGFVLLEDGSIRSPRRIQIELADQAPSDPQPKRRLLPTGGVARFSIREQGGGSGGTEYELRASKEAGDRWIVMTAAAQSEFRPDFRPAWGVLGSARRSGTK